MTLIIKISYLRACVVMSIALLCCSCSLRPNVVTQFATMDALMAGSYDGAFTCGEILKAGDTGLGTFDRLDGEMIVLDGQIYQVRTDGKAYPQNGTCSAPFAEILSFNSDKKIELPSAISKKQLEGLLTKHCKKDRLCAVKLHGDFTRVKARSVPAQNKPYPPLLEVIKTQSVFDLHNIQGTLLGFRSPASFAGVGAPGDHFHFLSDSRDSGGHLLDFELKRGTLEINNCDVFKLVFPATADATVDSSEPENTASGSEL